MKSKVSRHHPLSSVEKRAAWSLSMIYASRMLGLFMIFPIFSLYASDLEASTPALVGLALGAYGLTQALLQVPFGLLSDRWGRKPVIAFGLIIFLLGSVIAAEAETIYGVIAGRALQGCGAIASAVMALAADLSRESQRTKLMATLGISIGGAFMLAMILGPILANYLALSGIFYLTALLAFVAVVVLFRIVPTPVRSTHHRDAQASPVQFIHLLKNPELLRLDIGIFCLHLMVTCGFVAFPFILVDMGIETRWHWGVYLPVMLGALFVMVPMIIVAEAKKKMKQVFLVCILGLAFAGWLLAANQSTAIFYFAVLLFFSAFNTLEALLPSLVSKIAPPDQKGSAMGLYSSSQFLGAFCGGVLGGWIHGAYDVFATFWLIAGVAILWFVVAMTMKKPQPLKSYMVKIGVSNQERAAASANRLSGLPGVKEVVVVADEGVAYLKADPRELDEEALYRSL